MGCTNVLWWQCRGACSSLPSPGGCHLHPCTGKGSFPCEQKGTETPALLQTQGKAAQAPGITRVTLIQPLKAHQLPIGADSQHLHTGSTAPAHLASGHELSTRLTPPIFHLLPWISQCTSSSHGTAALQGAAGHSGAFAPSGLVWNEPQHSCSWGWLEAQAASPLRSGHRGVLGAGSESPLQAQLKQGAISASRLEICPGLSAISSQGRFSTPPHLF